MVLRDNQVRQLLLAVLGSSVLMVAGAATVAGQDPSPLPSTAVEAMPSTPSDAEMTGETASVQVDIMDFTFPADITVEAGSMITWHNVDAISHTVTATDGSFDSGRIEPSLAFEQSFTEPGIIAYSCLFHPAMTGTITVVEAPTSPEMSPPGNGASPSPEVTAEG